MNDFWKFPEYQLEMLLSTDYNIEKLYEMITEQIKNKYSE